MHGILGCFLGPLGRDFFIRVLHDSPDWVYAMGVQAQIELFSSGQATFDVVTKIIKFSTEDDVRTDAVVCRYTSDM